MSCCFLTWLGPVSYIMPTEEGVGVKPLTKQQLKKLVSKLKWGERVKVGGRWLTKTRLVRRGLGVKPQTCTGCGKSGHNVRTCQAKASKRVKAA